MTEIKVPAVGESISEVTLLKWNKKDGDYVERDEVIAELESEKATFEVNAEKAGVIKLASFNEGDTILIGDLIATIDESAAKPASENKDILKAEIKKDEGAAKKIIASIEPQKSAEPLKASPVASAIIADKKVDVKTVTPSGPSGKILKDDVLAALSNPGKKAFAGAELFTRNVRTEKMSNLRKTISKRLVEAKNTTAMLTTFNEVDMSATMEIRNKYKDKFKEAHGVGLGFMSFFAKACAIALSEWPTVNAYIDGDQLVYHDYADISIAVGAVTATGVVGGFSSYGPSGDGQIKPDLASVGVSALIQTTGNTVGMGNGTSFACPSMAGLGTILWQAFPEYNNMKIRSALWQSGSKYTTPDDRVGYGIPNMKTAFSLLLTEFATSTSSVNSCNATINWTSKDVASMRYEIERKVPGEVNYSKVGDVAAQAGDVLAIRNYQFNNTIISPTPGIVSYRIRQVIDTNAASFTAVYIDTTNVTISSGCFATGTGGTGQTVERIVLQPNPVSNTNTNLSIETPYAISNMPVLVYDSKGAQVMLIQSSKTSGKKIIEIQTSHLSKGKYYIKVLNGTKTLGTATLLVL